MTLTLDEVRRVRFRMARRAGHGYEVQDVDLFVDQVEDAFSKMANDAELLQRQVEALQSNAPAPAAGSSDNGELEALRKQLDETKRALDEANSAKDSAGRSNEEARAATNDLQNELDAARREVARLQGLQEQALAGDQRAEHLSAEVQRLANENSLLRRELDGAKSAAQSAQKAISDGPLENLVVTTSAEASPAVVRLVQLATEQAEQVVREASTEAERKVAEAETRAYEITTDARTKADRVESEARVNAETMTSNARNEADRVTGEAMSRAGQIDNEAAARRHELFTGLESERDDLAGKVEALRSFENSYRQNLVNHLQAQLDNVSKARPEPGDVPELANRSGSTPRLDALMGGQD